MSNNEFSSIEWLYNKMVIKLCNKLQTIEYRHIFIQEFQDAIAMHKEEIINAVQSCGYIGGETDEEAEDYYNETFGGNNEQQ